MQQVCHQGKDLQHPACEHLDFVDILCYMDLKQPKKNHGVFLNFGIKQEL